MEKLGDIGLSASCLGMSFSDSLDFVLHVCECVCILSTHFIHVSIGATISTVELA